MNERIRDVFAAPPAEFVRARDALVKELRGAGRDAEAKEVAALRRPTAAVWAVNQLPRRHPGELDEFIETSERVRHAQMRGAAADELRAAMAAQRSALARLEQAAAEVLRGAGAQASPAALRTVQSTLQAAASGPRELREQLREGTVREALEPAGFEALLGAKPTVAVRGSTASRAGARAEASREERSPKEIAREAKAARRAAEREAKRQAADARKRARAARAAEVRVRKLEQKAEAAEQSAARAREALARAREVLERLKS